MKSSRHARCSGERPHTLALTLHDQAVTVVLDFVDPFLKLGTFVPVRCQGSKDLEHGGFGRISDRGKRSEASKRGGLTVVRIP